MTAELTDKYKPDTAFKTSHRKGSCPFFWSLIVVDPEALAPECAPTDGRMVVDARFYPSQGGCTAAVWLHRGALHRSATGRTRGCGYDRPSSALADALHSMGVKLSEPIDGAGLGPMRQALLALARAAGVVNPVIFEIRM